MSYYKLKETWLNSSKENWVNDKPLFYVHIPKTGGTLIESLFNNYKVGKDYEYWKSSECIKNNPSYWHVLPSKCKKLDFSKLNVFVSIRDPIDRILSQFLWERNFRRGEDDLNKWVVNRINEHRTMNHLRDNHFEQQIKYMVDYFGNKIPYKNIIICDKHNYLENINNFAKRNKLKMISYDKALKNIKKTHTNKTNYDEYYKKLKPETIKLIKDYYKDDYTLLENVKKYNLGD